MSSFLSLMYLASIGVNFIYGNFDCISLPQIEAFDPDSGASGEMVFHVEGGEEEDKAFNVKDFGDGTADLITKVKFDREDPTNVKVPGTSIYYEFERIGNKITYPVTVKVEDKNQNPLRSYCSFLVTIVDVNDNGPEFDINRKELSEYHRLIPMNPTLYIPLYRAFALDRDEGENSIVVYSLTNINCEDCFAVNNDGYITAQKDLKNVLVGLIFYIVYNIFTEIFFG